MFIHELFPVSLILVVFESLINITAPCIMASKWIATWLSNECLLSDLISPCMFAHFTVIYAFWYHHCLNSFTEIRAEVCLLRGSLYPGKDTEWEKRKVWVVLPVSLIRIRKISIQATAELNKLRKVRYTMVAILGYIAHGSNKNPSCWVYLQGHFLTKAFDVGRHTLHPNFLRREDPP